MKILRFFSYVLFITIFLYFVTGLAMEKQLFSFEIASYLHKKLLPAFAVLAFIGHTSMAIRFSLMRKKLWNKFTSIWLALFYLLLGFSFVYYQYFYKTGVGVFQGLKTNYELVKNNVGTSIETFPGLQEPGSAANEINNITSEPTTNTNVDANASANQTQVQTQTQATQSAQTQPTIKTNSSGQRIFTLDELKKYNGKNGNPAYVVVDGIVYDVSSVFKNGSHQGYSAGQDLSSAFHSQHSMSKLKGLPVTGVLQ